jgi:hypothetical protein
MKLFQIEEPDGAPLDSDAPGVAVGIAIAPGPEGRIAIAVGGNAEILPDADGARSRAGKSEDAEGLRQLLLALRSQAEKQLARPVTHAVIAADGRRKAAIEAAAAATGIAVLLTIEPGEAARLAGSSSADAAALGAALRAEDLAPAAT